MRAIVGAVCFVLHDQQVLLLQRNHGAFLGKWDAAGGVVEFGETPSEAAVRELAEETGVRAETCELRAQLLLYNVDNGTVVSSYLFVTDRWSGELRESEEGRAEWVPLERLQETDLIDFMHITLPLVLTPGSLLMGTIRHTTSGAPVSYELHHYTLDGVRTLRVEGRPLSTRRTGGIEAMHVFLETDRLVLRRFTEADVENLYELDSDSDVMRFINSGKPTPRDVIASEVLPRFLWYYERFAAYGFWAAIERSTGEFLGWFHYRPAEGRRPDEPELGYRLRKSAWGKGYATEGSRALIQMGFTELGVERVFATTMTVNLASRRVMEKAGLRFVRTFYEEWPEYIEGAEHGDVEYALERADWEQQARQGSW